MNRATVYQLVTPGDTDFTQHLDQRQTSESITFLTTWSHIQHLSCYLDSGSQVAAAGNRL